MKKESWIPAKNIELSLWKTPLGIGHSNVKEPELEAYYDEDDLAQLKQKQMKRRFNKK